MQVIGYDFIQNIDNGTKQPLSTKVISQFFTVNLLNLEFVLECPLRTFIHFNFFLASLLLPILAYDTFVKPVIGVGPTYEGKYKKKKEVVQHSHEELDRKKFKEGSGESDNKKNK